MAILTGRVAVITGAGSGIGQAVARLFAREGATLVINDLGTDVSGAGADPTVISTLGSELRTSGVAVVESSEDISTQSGVESLMAAATESCSGIDILVNCAGILRERALLNMHERDLVAVFEVHVMGTFRLMQAAAQHMRVRGGGRIINTTSQSALFGNTGQCANAAAAAAVIGMTRSAAIELQRYGVFANVVAPLAKTRQTEALPLFQKANGLTAEHVAPAYLFLASGLAGDITGEVIAIAGSRLSALHIEEGRGVFAPSERGLFDVESLSAAWHQLTS